MKKNKPFYKKMMKIDLKNYSRANIKTFNDKDLEYWDILEHSNKTNRFGKCGLWIEKKDCYTIEEGIYLKGKKHGLWKYWKDNSEEELFYMISYKKGKLHGLCKLFTFMKNKINLGIFPKEKYFTLTKDLIYFYDKEVAYKEYNKKGLILFESYNGSIDLKYIGSKVEEVKIDKNLLKFLFHIALSSKYEKYAKYYQNLKIMVIRYLILFFYCTIYFITLMLIKYE